MYNSLEKKKKQKHPEWLGTTSLVSVTPPSLQLTDTASSVKTESALVLDAALFWTAVGVVAASRRI